MEIIYSIIVPIYNEEDVLPEFYKKIECVMRSAKENYELVFINDGSKDKSSSIISELYKVNKAIKLINFSRNFGHQAAITAGMRYAKGKAIIVIDSDLQDPPEIILKMILKWKEGYDVVYAKRSKRIGESIFKKATAKIYYRVLKNITNFNIPVDTGDFRLIDRKVCNALNNLQEKNRYVRGLISWLGYNQTYIEYERDSRFAGDTKYSFTKMLKFSIDGITSFSYVPLKISTLIGSIMFFLSLTYLIFLILQKNPIEGWQVAILILLFTQGLLLCVISIIGQYIARIYDETKNRPIYIINDTLGYDENEVD